MVVCVCGGWGGVQGSFWLLDMSRAGYQSRGWNGDMYLHFLYTSKAWVLRYVFLRARVDSGVYLVDV